jgi:hypothetical protein
MTPYIDTKSVHSKSEAMAELSHIDENIMLNEAAEFSGKESPVKTRINLKIAAPSPSSLIYLICLKQ